MRKFIVTTLAVLAFIIMVYCIFMPNHLHSDHEMQHCGGCHSEGSTIVCIEGYIDPMENECIGCHNEAMTGFSVHNEIIPGECDRCHEFADEPMYSDCDLCHATHSHLVDRTNNGKQPCVTCHESHSFMTDSYCAKCHNEEFSDLKTHGGKHSDISGSCYACHVEHKSIPDCLDCHKDTEHSGGYIISTDCNQCHDEHMPKEVNFSSGITTEQCIICHPAAGQEFQDNPSKHSDIECVECHQQHLDKAKCVTCHADPHPGLSDMTVDKCLACHGDAHTLNRYGY